MTVTERITEIDEAAIASLLNVKVNTVGRWRRRGLLPKPTRTVGARTYLYDATTIEAWAKRSGRWDAKRIGPPKGIARKKAEEDEADRD